MRVLILGGTGFVGRAIVAALRAGGAATTRFNRGRDPASPGLVGDRDTGDYTALRGREFDAVVDVSGYLPRHVREVAGALGDRVGRYLFISSHAVFDGGRALRRPPVRDAAPPLTDATYGPAKVACEDELLTRYGPATTIVRPGKVAGPYDNQDGLTYWVRRAARGGRIAVPGSLAQPVQIVDSRDLAAFVVRLLTEDRAGAFTAVGPRTTLGGLVGVCAAAAGARVTPVPIALAPRPFPLVKPVESWPTQRRDAAPGFRSRPLAETVADVLAWDRGRGGPPLGRGFTAADEARILGGAR